MFNNPTKQSYMCAFLSPIQVKLLAPSPFQGYGSRLLVKTLVSRSRPIVGAIPTRARPCAVFVVKSTATVSNESTGGNDTKILDALRTIHVYHVSDGSLAPLWSSSSVPAATLDKTLVVVLPQLGEFDACEYVELLVAVLDDLTRASLSLKVVGLGDLSSARKFATFSGLPTHCLYVVTNAELHQALACHRGPNWNTPSWLPSIAQNTLLTMLPGSMWKSKDQDYQRETFRAWLNYMAMCAGIAAPGTLPEILRGYFGDRNAPERLASDAVVRAGPISIQGTTRVQIGNRIAYSTLWKNATGYQRPIELATLRLRCLAQVLENFDDYVPDPRFLDWRGATYIIDNTTDAVLYKYKSPGVLTYSATMARPLEFLRPYIGQEKSLNPLGLGDPRRPQAQPNPGS